MVVAGIDIGGTFIKGGLVNERGEILINGSIRTECTQSGLVEGVVRLISRLLREKGIDRGELSGLGLGIPGMIDGEAGCVRYSNNLRIEDFFIVRELAKRFSQPIRITNDANAAALGESKFGIGRGFSDSILVTLGTGVGGGVILGGKLFEGGGGVGAELGHMIVVVDGKPCTCGQRGCLEAYASATALIRDTREAMLNHPESSMCEVPPEEVDGRTAFDRAGTDETAAAVVKNYIKYLAAGLVNFANIFRPQVIMLGGGISKEGERLTRPLQEWMDANVFGGERGPRVEIRTASLGNKAGLLGAAALVMEE